MPETTLTWATLALHSCIILLGELDDSRIENFLLTLPLPNMSGERGNKSVGQLTVNSTAEYGGPFNCERGSTSPGQTNVNRWGAHCDPGIENQLLNFGPESSAGVRILATSAYRSVSSQITCNSFHNPTAFPGPSGE